jgi:hypothetical protein
MDANARMHRDKKELLIGSVTIMLFGIALVVWPLLGEHIHDAVYVPIDFILSLF